MAKLPDPAWAEYMRQVDSGIIVYGEFCASEKSSSCERATWGGDGEHAAPDL